MKAVRVLLLGFMIVATSGIFAIAQDQQPSDDTAVAQRGPDQVVEAMASKLNLTEEQKQQIRPMIEERQQKLRDLMSDSSTRRMKKARKAKSIMSDSDKKIEAILNNEQKKQYAEMKAEMKEKMRERAQERKQSGGQ